MCEICRQYPCHPCCPNADEIEPIYICDNCKEGIYDGEYVFEIGGCKYCEGCINDSRYTAEAPEPYEPDEDRIYDEWRDRQMMEEWEHNNNA